MTHSRFHSVGLSAIFFAAVVLSGCATPPEDPDARAAFEEANDSIESTNRAIFAFNRALDRTVIKPVAQAYADYVPMFGRQGLRNLLNNMRSPVIFANDVMQLKPRRAFETASRAVLNTLLGVGGLFDVASTGGLEFHDEDFGQTLAVWGVPEGPFLMLPVFGPSNPRDTVGLIADGFLDPLSYLASNNDVEYALAVRGVADGVDKRAEVLDVLDEIERTSLDFYATIRSLYRQRRESDIADGVLPPEVPGPSILTKDGEELEEVAPEKAAL